MSEEKRLGVNPLSWVDSNAPTKDAIPVSNVAGIDTPPATQGNGVDTEITRERLFEAPATIDKEDLMGKGKVKIKQAMDTAQAISHLEDLAESLASGVVRAANGEDSVVLCVGDSMKFEMKLSRKKGRAKCAIEMEWDDDGSKAEGFKISN